MDNKYANLPGIAKNEADTFETPDVPINYMNKIDMTEEDSTNIHKINVTLKDAQSKFNKGSLNNAFADFSDTISNRRKFGFIVEPDTFEWNQDPSETPLQRFKRLEQELNELKRDLSEMESSPSNDSSDNKPSYDPIELTKQLESLRNQINSSHLQSIGARVNASQLDNKAKKNLLVDYLNEMKKSLSKKTEGDKNSNTAHSIQDPSAFIFKLFSDIEQIDLDRANKVSTLNQRLSNLEKIFGPGNASFSENQIGKLCPEIENKTLLGVVENLNMKLSLLEGQSLETIESRIQMITQKVNALNDKKTVIEDQEKMNRVNELYKLLSNYKDMSSKVAVIVERLASLNEIHQKAFQFSSMLSRMDSDQESMKKSMEINSEVLSELKKKFETNLESIRASFDSLNERVLAINK